MRIHLTGGHGFLGTYIARELSLSHEVDVTGTRTADVTDAALLARVLSARRPDVLVHLAALCGAQPSVENPHRFFLVNAQGTANVLEACRGAGVSRVLVMSSMTVHGASDAAMTETSPYAPRHPYAAAKVCAEVTTEMYARRYGLRALLMRPTLVIGEGYKEPHALGDFVATVKRGEPIEIYGTGAHQRDFVHPEDVARAVGDAVRVLAGAPEGFCEKVNVANGEPLEVRRLAEVVIEELDRGSLRFAAPTAQSFSLFTSIEKAERLLGWRPRLSVRDIVRRLDAVR